MFSLLLAGASVAAAQLGYVERVRARLWGHPPRLSAADFPAGVMAPVDAVAAIPTRPTLVGVVPRGALAPLMWAAGDTERVGLFRAAYALEVKVVLFEREEELRRALVKGGENGGVDLAAFNVSSLASSAAQLRDAAPRTLLLLGRSRGHEELVGVSGVSLPAQLRGRRLGVEPRSAASYFAWWVLSRAGLAPKEVTVVPLESSFAASQALRGHTVDAVAGFTTELAQAVQDTQANVVATSADAPHLNATVLVTRGDFAARYPDAIRRLLRGVLDANAQVLKDPQEAARVLGTLWPQLGDPTEALRLAPPATLKDNIAFFNLEPGAPVTYLELYQSASALAVKLSAASTPSDADDSADLGPLKYVVAAQGP